MCAAAAAAVSFFRYTFLRVCFLDDPTLSHQKICPGTPPPPPPARQFKILSTWETGRVCAGRPFRAHVFFPSFLRRRRYNALQNFILYYMRGNVLRSLYVGMGVKGVPCHIYIYIAQNRQIDIRFCGKWKGNLI